MILDLNVPNPIYGSGFGIIFLPNLKIGYGSTLFGARDPEYSDNHIPHLQPYTMTIQVVGCII